jgi:hypothetical protein
MPFVDFQTDAGLWGHQPGRPAVGGVSTAHNQHNKTTM